jgi:peptide chain release factor
MGRVSFPEEDLNMFSDISPGQVREEDIEEHFIRSSGPGGQNVNKVATCVFLIHRPTGIQVKCQSERTQYLNRMKARELLSRELIRRVRAQRERLASEREKRRRQNRSKPRALKKRILEQKRQHSDKKKLRGPVHDQ